MPITISPESRAFNTAVSLIAQLLESNPNLNNKEELLRQIAEVKQNPYFSIPNKPSVPILNYVFGNEKYQNFSPEVKKFILSNLYSLPDLKDIYSKEKLLEKYPSLQQIVDSPIRHFLDPTINQILEGKRNPPPPQTVREEIPAPAPRSGVQDIINRVAAERNPSLNRPSSEALQRSIAAERLSRPSEAAAPEGSGEPTRQLPPEVQANRNLQEALINARFNSSLPLTNYRQYERILDILQGNNPTQLTEEDRNLVRNIVGRPLTTLENNVLNPTPPQNRRGIDQPQQPTQTNISSAPAPSSESRRVTFPNEPETIEPPAASNAVPLTAETLRNLGTQQSSPVGRSVYTNYTESVPGTESEMLNDMQQDIIRNPEAYRQPAQEQLEQEHAYRQGQDFEFDDLPRPEEGEHYLAALNRWLSQQALKYLKTKHQTNSPIVADDALIHTAEAAMMKELMNGTEKSDQEKDFNRFYKDLLTNYKNNTQTKSQALLDLAAEDITPEEVEKYKNPHVKGIMDTLFNRDLERFEREKRRRAEAHNEEMARRFHGNVYSSGARNKYQQNFLEREKDLERDFYNDVSRREQELLYKGDIEGWARAKGKRETLERNAQLNEGIAQNRLRNAVEANQARVNMNNAQMDRRLKLQLAQKQLGEERTERAQQKRNIEQADALRAQQEPLVRMRNAQGIINNFQVPLTAETSLPTYRPPEPQRSAAGSLGGTIWSLNNAFQQQQNNQAQANYYNAQSQLLQQQLANPTLQGRAPGLQRG